MHKHTLYLIRHCPVIFRSIYGNNDCGHELQHTLIGCEVYCFFIDVY